MKKVMVQSVLLTALATVSLALPACTDEQVSDTALAIGAAVIVGAAVAGAPDRPYDGYRGGFHDGDRDGGGYRPHSVEDFSTTDATVSNLAFKSTDERVQTVADKYAISDYAATYVVRAIVLAQQKDTSGISDLGLETADLQSLYQGQELDSAKIDTMSQKLLMQPAAATTLVKEMSDDIQAYRSK